MNKDGVEAAFQRIIEEIEAVAADIAEKGGVAFRNKDYDVAQQLGESGKSLEDFRTRVESLLEDWQRGIDTATRQRFAQRGPREPTPAAPKPKKAGKTRLRVVFGDGTVIDERFAADTFAKALRHMGLARVEALGLTEVGLPLVGTVRSDVYPQKDGSTADTSAFTQARGGRGKFWKRWLGA